MTSILRKTDIWLMAALVFAAAVLYFLSVPGRSAAEGAGVVVSVDGVVCERLPLWPDREIAIPVAGGVSTNTLAIRQGQAVMLRADCPDGLCLRHRPIGQTGETIVCLPNRVLVEVVGGDAGEGAGYDAVLQ